MVCIRIYDLQNYEKVSLLRLEHIIFIYELANVFDSTDERTNELSNMHSGSIHIVPREWCTNPKPSINKKAQHRSWHTAKCNMLQHLK